MTSIYTLTIFTSAFLLFLIQPMISKLLLPQLGGSPAVWNTSMMFFQVMLLLGYLYAHAGAKWLGARRQFVLHLALLGLSLAWLPISVNEFVTFASVERPIFWIVVTLFCSVGFPFFVLAANAPLLQFWLANTDHKDAKDPYFLYSASNIGSLLALLGYPFLIEPHVTLANQTLLWSGLFAAFIGLLVWSGAYMRRRYRGIIPSPTGGGVGSRQSCSDGAHTTPLLISPLRGEGLRQRLRWVALAFFPSSLLLGVTTYITTDIASLPLFWVIPLAIYLLTFILAFARTPLMVDRALNAQISLVPFTAMAMAFEINFIKEVLILHLFTFFAIAMGCHGTLARSKPDSRHLTEFFLWVSFGGMLGGIFNSLIAPLVFTNPIEYTLVLVLSLFMRPKQLPDSKREKLMDVMIPTDFLLFLWVAFYATGKLYASGAIDPIDAWFRAHISPDPRAVFAVSSGPILVSLLFLLVMLVAYKTSVRPVRFGLAMAALLVIVPLTGFAPSSKYMPNVIYAERNFFGVNRVIHAPESQAMVLMHGTTLHGMQALDEEHRLQPVSYYGTLREVFEHLPREVSEKPVAVLGLGAGTLACLGKKSQPFDFYEIDPAVAAIAENKKFFTYLADCGPKYTITLGDGRLQLSKAKDGTYGIMVMDAFSSDAIPMHLVTREALKLYASKLADGGVLAFNISNRHLNLVPVMAALAEDTGLHALHRVNMQPKGRLARPSNWVVMTRDAANFKALMKDDPEWKPLENKTRAEPWTDNYSNIFETLF